MAKKKWVQDPSLLVMVEDRRESIPVKDKKGNIKGGKEYYGVPKQEEKKEVVEVKEKKSK